MRVLVLSHRLPYPPTDGSRVRAFHAIRHFQRRHAVTVAAPVRSAEEAANAAALRSHGATVLTERITPLAAAARMLARLPTRTPSSMGFFDAPRLRRRVRAAIAGDGFDFIYVHSSSVAPYVADAAAVPKLLDFVDMDSQKWLAYTGVRGFPLSAGYRLEGRKLQAAEAALAGRFDVCTCITRGEMETLEGFGAACATGWFPNGVDLETFCRGDEAYDPNALCFVGRMDYFPNQDAMLTFCREVWPAVRAARPNARLTIVGAAPPASIRALGALPGITVTGTVADVRPHVRTAAASVAPLRLARGTQNKILESWALGVPVVASTPAARGVDAEPGRDFLLADGAEATAAALLRLMGDPALRQRLADAGRARVEALYTWDAAMARLDGYVDLARARHRAHTG